MKTFSIRIYFLGKNENVFYKQVWHEKDRNEMTYKGEFI